MSKRKKEKITHKGHHNDLIALLDMTKERVLERKVSEYCPSQFEQNVAEDEDCKDMDYSSVSSSSINEMSKTGILDQIAEIKELFKNQSQKLENFKHDVSKSPQSPKSPKSPKSPNLSREFLRPRVGSKEFIPRMREGISSIESVFAKAIIENNEEDYSIIASTLLGIGQKKLKKHLRPKHEPILSFLKKPKKLSFKEQVFIKSHVSIFTI